MPDEQRAQVDDRFDVGAHHGELPVAHRPRHGPVVENPAC